MNTLTSISFVMSNDISRVVVLACNIHVLVTVLQLKLLVAVFSLWRPGFILRVVLVEFVVSKVALGWFYEFFGCPLSI